MVHPLFQKRRDSLSRAPDYSTKRDTIAFLKREKQSPSDVDYKPASDDSKKRCHECVNYGKYGQPEADCKKVVGIVKAEGVCDLFRQRKYDDDEVGTTPTEVVISVRHGS